MLDQQVGQGFEVGVCYVVVGIVFQYCGVGLVVGEYGVEVVFVIYVCLVLVFDVVWWWCVWGQVGVVGCVVVVGCLGFGGCQQCQQFVVVQVCYLEICVNSDCQLVLGFMLIRF